MLDLLEGVEAKVSGPQARQLGQVEAQIAPGFEQVEGQVLGRTETSGESVAKKPAHSNFLLLEKISIL